jgi:hypothetical protein
MHRLVAAETELLRGLVYGFYSKSYVGLYVSDRRLCIDGRHVKTDGRHSRLQWFGCLEQKFSILLDV